MIDFAQVLMLTFVNGFKEAMAINLSNAFGISNLVTFNPKGIIKMGTLFPALILSLILVVVAIFTMVVYVVVLLWRIITLWVLMVLSPIAFVGAAFPGLKKYTGQFWEKFWSTLTLGIALAFFMWLALTFLAVSGQGENKKVVEEFDVSKVVAENAELQGDKKKMGIAGGGDPAITSISKGENLFTFVVAIALLLMALQYAQQAGGFAGKFAGAASARLSKMGTGIAKAPFKAAKFGLSEAVSEAADKLHEKTGVDLNLKRVWGNIKRAREDRKKDQYGRGRKAAADTVREGNFVTSRLAAATGGAYTHYREFGFWKGTGKLAPVTLPGGKLTEKILGKGKGFNLMGKKAQEVSDIINKKVDKEKEEADQQAKLAAMGGSNGVYLNQGQEAIQEERDELIKTKEKYENLDKAGAITPEEQASLKEVNTAIARLDNEEMLLKVYLDIAGVDADKLNDSDLYMHLAENDRKRKENKKETNDLKAEKAKLEAKQATESDPEKFEKNKISIKEKEEKIKKLEKEEEYYDVYDAKFRLTANNVREGGRLDPGVLNKIRKKIAQTKNVDITDAAKEYRKNQAEKIQKRIEELKKEKPEDRLEGEDKKDPEKIKLVERDIAKEKEKLENEHEFLEKQNALAKEGKMYLKDTEKESLLAESKEHRDKEGALRVKATKTRPVVDFEAQQYNRAMEAEEMKKVEYVDSDAELIAMYRDAQARKNQARMAAIHRKLTRDGNDNELYNAYGYKSGFKGQQEFFNKEVLSKADGGARGCFSKQQMLSYANDIAYINEAIGHWNTARVAGMDNGRWRWYSEKEHVAAATVEISKRGSRDIVTKLNRLAFGGEGPSRIFELEALGAALLRQNAVNWTEQERLILEHMNMNLAQDLLGDERRTGVITRVLKGIYVHGEKVSEKFIKVLEKKLGAKERLETWDMSVNIVCQPNFGA